ncbi:MAG: polyprenyl synthetase family protein [Thermoprotei archaeon]
MSSNSARAENARSLLLERLSEDARTVSARMSEVLKGEPAGLYEAASYMPSLGGKRMRPFVTLQAGRLFGETYDATVYAAVGVELLHNFTLVHDDIMDRDDFRRNKPTVHKKYGDPVAILAGDLLFSKAFWSAVKSEEAAGRAGVVEALSEASTRVDEGQYLDMSFESRRDVSESEYLEMIKLKTAALYECSAVMGGIAGGRNGSSIRHATEPELEALREYGLNLGLAFQIRDDYLGSFGSPETTGKPVGNDIKRGKKTLVVICALERCSPSQAARLSSTLGNLSASEREVNDAIGLLREIGVDSECEKTSLKYAAKAAESISTLPETEARVLLSSLAEYAALRNS